MLLLLGGTIEFPWPCALGYLCTDLYPTTYYAITILNISYVLTGDFFFFFHIKREVFK